MDRIKRTCSVAVVVAVVAALVTACQAQSPDRAVEQELLALEQARNIAMVHADVAELDKTTSDDFTAISPNHLGSKQDMLADLKSGRLKYQSIETSDVKVRVYGHAAVLTGTRTVKGEHAGRSLDGRDWFTRVYVKNGPQWQCVAFQSTPAKR